MKVTVLQSALKYALATVGRAVPSKSPFTLPVLQNIHVRAHDDRLTLTATNLEFLIETWVGAKIEEEGATTLPAKLFTDTIGALPNDKITLTLDGRTETTHIKCARAEVNIKGIESDEFPKIPSAAAPEAFGIDPRALRTAIAQTAFAAAADDTRPVLAGVLFAMQDETLTLAAADGYRLSVSTINTKRPLATNAVIIPARAVAQPGALLKDQEDELIYIHASAEHIRFHLENADLITVLISGKFPDYQRIIPQQYTTRTIVDRAELMKAIKLAGYFAANTSMIIRLEMEPVAEGGASKLTISANAAEVGDNHTAMDALISGTGGKIALNTKYLAEAIGSFTSPQIAIETQAATNPAVCKPVGFDGYTHVLMPLIIK